MTSPIWLEFFWANRDLYLWGSYLVGTTLIVVELVLLVLRERTIAGHLGWSGIDPPPANEPGPRTQSDAARRR